MKQVVQNYKTGKLSVEEVPMPVISPKSVLFKTESSLISAGTERTKIETASMNLIEKAISRLDLVKILINNIKQEGLIFTLKKAFNKLDSEITLGYSASGVVLGAINSEEFKEGDRICAVGEVMASHAEMNRAPENFVVSIPDKVNFNEASFVGLGAIANNAVDISQARAKEKVIVIGLGLLGQIVSQILKARGCEVLGVELDDDKIKLARKLGLDKGINPITDDVNATVRSFTKNEGADLVIITAASKNNLPIIMAGGIARNKGRVILVGAVDINIPRKEFYEKELLFMISRGFGADLYYKVDYTKEHSFAYTPKTVKENMSTFLDLVSSGDIDVKSLISHKFKIDEAETAYNLIRENKEKYLGILFNYDSKIDKREKIVVDTSEKKKESLGVGFIGAGSFATGYLLPSLKKSKLVDLIGVCTSTSVNSKNVLRKFGFKYSTTDYKSILENKDINCVFIATRHDMHARFVLEALDYGKKVFVEKPLALNSEELDKIKHAYNKDFPVMVGFNRRFSPYIIKTKAFIGNRVSPLVVNYRVNAGFLPSSHWSQDKKVGGGRIVGEMCHFVDLLQFIVGAKPVSLYATCLNNADIELNDNVSITLNYEDGSIGTINYNSIGDSSFSRERLELFCDSKVAVLDNYKNLSLTSHGRTKKFKKFTRDMGHNSEVKNFVDSLIKDNKSLISFDDLVTTTEVTFKIIESLKSDSVIHIK